jgi:hypothetical protein
MGPAADVFNSEESVQRCGCRGVGPELNVEDCTVDYTGFEGGRDARWQWQWWT